MKKLIFALITTLLILPLTVWGQEIPTPTEALSVSDFYFNGKGQGVVLMDSKVCEGIEREGDNKYDCFNEIIEFKKSVDPQTPPEILHKVSEKQPIYVWMKYLVPIGAKEVIKVQYSLNGEILRTSTLKVKDSLRYRTWSKFTPWKTGNWNVKILLDKKDKPLELKSFELKVN